MFLRRLEKARTSQSFHTEGQKVVDAGVGLAGDMLGIPSLSSSRQALSWGSLFPQSVPAWDNLPLGICPHAHWCSSHLQNLTISLTRFSSALGVAQMPVGSLGMPLGIHSFMPDHFPCPGCRARKRVRSALAGGIKSPQCHSFLSFQGRACSETLWTAAATLASAPHTRSARSPL